MSRDHGKDGKCFADVVYVGTVMNGRRATDIYASENHLTKQTDLYSERWVSDHNFLAAFEIILGAPREGKIDGQLPIWDEGDAARSSPGFLQFDFKQSHQSCCLAKASWLNQTLSYESLRPYRRFQNSKRVEEFEVNMSIFSNYIYTILELQIPRSLDSPSSPDYVSI